MNKRQRKKHATRLRDCPSYFMKNVLGLTPVSEGHKRNLKKMDKAIRKRNKDKDKRALPFTVFSYKQPGKSSFNQSIRESIQSMIDEVQNTDHDKRILGKGW